KWVIPALKQIREICSLFGEAPQNLSSSRFSQTQRSPHVFYRHDLINQLQHNHALVTLVAENLATYMESMRLYARVKFYMNHCFISISWPQECFQSSVSPPFVVCISTK
uniref:Ubiquitin specific peptidase 9 X-linked n=1 Tax=Equus asinus TaxID=9793 RepID=A0A9L0I8F1_EQUAS